MFFISRYIYYIAFGRTLKKNCRFQLCPGPADVPTYNEIMCYYDTIPNTCLYHSIAIFSLIQLQLNCDECLLSIFCNSQYLPANQLSRHDSRSIQQFGTFLGFVCIFRFILFVDDERVDFLVMFNRCRS